MANFEVSRAPVPDWRNGPGLPERPMADQIADVLEGFDDEKDLLSIGALTQGMRWIDQCHDKNDTIDTVEWQAVSRAMRAALGDNSPIAGRAERLVKAFEHEAGLLSAAASAMEEGARAATSS